MSSLHARTGTRSGRGVHNQPVTSVPGFGPARRAPERRGQLHHAPARPHTLPVATARLSRRRYKRSALEPRTAGGNYNECAQLSTVIIKAKTNADHATTRAVMFHLGNYIPQGVPDTFGFNGIDTSQCTGDTVALTHPSGISGLGTKVKFRWNGNGVELIGNTGG